MTNKEAINLISRNKSVFKYDPEMIKALNLAIKALEEVKGLNFTWCRKRREHFSPNDSCEYFIDKEKKDEEDTNII